MSANVGARGVAFLRRGAGDFAPETDNPPEALPQGGDYFAVKSTTSLKISGQRMRTLVTKRADTSASIPHRVCQALEKPMDELTTIVSGEEKNT